LTELIWLGFGLSLALLLIIARRSVWVALIVSSLTLGIFGLPFNRILWEIYKTLTNPSILLLALGIGLIPMIGGAMEEGGLMNALVQNLRIGKRLFSGIAPALLGMLPIPGGALLSAPLLKMVGKGISEIKKSAINVWFRHILLLIYPLGALLVTTKMAGLNLYGVIPYLFPGLILMFILGYLFLLKDVKGGMSYSSDFRLRGLLIPIMVILIAPFIHFLLITLFPEFSPEIFLVIGISTSLILAFYLGKLSWRDLKSIWLKMEPWKFSLIIIGMFLFLNMFKASDVSKVIADIAFSRSFLIVGIGAFFGFVTGRVQIPVSILLPIYYSKYGENTMTPLIFSIMFFSIFMGYVISPVHPCVSVSLEFFKVSLKNFFKTLIIPTIIALAIAFIFATILL